MRAGAKAFTVYNHMLMPTWYDNPEADYWHLIKNVTLWDVAVERQVEISGRDALHLVRLMTPRNLEQWRVGQCKYLPIIDENGGMLNDPLLLPVAEDRFWLSIADSDILLYAKGLASGLGLEVKISEPDVSPLAIQGPRSEEVAVKLLGDEVRKLGFFRFKQVNLDGIPFILARSGWSKQGGFELYLQDSRLGDDLWERIMTAGAEFNIKPAAPSSMERIESGLLSYGNDMTIENNPFEIGLDSYCDLEQPFDFIGKKALQEIKARGIRQKLMGLSIKHEGDRLPVMGRWWPLETAAGEAGHITSSSYSPRLQRQIAMAMVPIQSAVSGAEVWVDTPLGKRQAVLQELPFI
jgi:glycine cleavage system aminomethyltransferase T